jgi:hypothetical protein
MVGEKETFMWLLEVEIFPMLIDEIKKEDGNYANAR